MADRLTKLSGSDVSRENVNRMESNSQGLRLHVVMAYAQIAGVTVERLIDPTPIPITSVAEL